MVRMIDTKWKRRDLNPQDSRIHFMNRFRAPPLRLPIPPRFQNRRQRDKQAAADNLICFVLIRHIRNV